MAQAIPDAVAAALRRWHDMVETGDLAALMRAGVQFCSPVAFKPYQGAPASAIGS